MAKTKIVDLNRDELKAALKAADIEFNGRLGVEKLTALAVEHGIEITKEVKAGSIVPESYKKAYGKDGNCGDELAAALREFTLGDKGACDERKLEEVMEQNAIEADRWSGLNVGQRRMNLGNVLRARLKNGVRVEVGEAVWNEDGEVAQAA